MRKLILRKNGGRPKKMNDEQVATALDLYFVEGMPIREVADVLGVSHMTVWRLIAKSEPPKGSDLYEKNEGNYKVLAK
ncbi:MAG: helix-turn-helix domain-containing protein [Candidatus Micrarchaeota archaeon]|nr:helix-turn-helix domain-containing protein [Candidatus Micrarchaeota archaeon]